MINSTKISAAFLAAVLFTGTIALSFPSFMADVQAEPYYGMDRDKKSNGKDVNVKSVKCNNINVNVNGLELNLTSVPFLGGLLASEAGENGEKGTGSYGSGGQQSHYDKDFKFVCINNNNNTVVGVGNEIRPTPEEECEDCFAQVLNASSFASLERILEIRGIDVFVGTTQIEINSLAELCDILENVSGTILVSVVTQILRNLAIILTPGEFLELVTCIGTAFGITIPPILGPIIR